MIEEPESAMPEPGFKAAFPLIGAGVALVVLLAVVAIAGGVMMMMHAA